MSDWLRIPDAKCVGRTELFFSLDAELIARAKALCRECPGQLPCLDYAIATGADDGVWGGHDFRDRRKLLRRLRTRQGAIAAQTHATHATAL